MVFRRLNKMRNFRFENSMKNLLTYMTLFALLISALSCNHNRLKTNGKELTKEIFILEKQNAETERAEHEKELADALTRPKNGVLLKENRTVDPSHPPVILDIAGNLSNIKDIKLSDVASETRYVRMEMVPDSTFSRVMKFKYYLLSDYIVATNPSGIVLYSKNGKFISIIVKNKTTGIDVDTEWMRVLGTNTFIGGGTSVWNNGDSLYYAYRNSISGQEYIMKYDLSKVQFEVSKKFEPENPEQIIGLGDVATDMNPLKKKEEWKYRISPELVSWGMSSDFIYQSVGTFIINGNSYAKELTRTDNISVINNNGDTLTTFTGFEKGNTLRFENLGKNYLWNALNDTVFQVIGNNRILPVYVLHSGQYKASLEQVRQIGGDLTGKIIPRQWAENRRYIFLVFAKDAFDSPNNRRYKKVKLFHALYSKQSKELFVLKGDPFNYSPEILENNIDGGLPVWPLSYMIGSDGEMLISLKGNELKERIKSELFKLSKAPEAKKKELEKIAEAVSESEDILMIIK
jgi:hypothetical protein